MLESNFWNDKDNSEKVVNELNLLKKNLKDTENLKNKIKSSLDLLDMLKLEDNKDMQKELENDISSIEEEVSNLEILLLLSGPYDECDCILDIHPGAGGTESCDWASMLYRMYTRWCEKNGYKIEVVDYQDGDEAGIKSVSIIIKGLNAYGYLKCDID